VTCEAGKPYLDGVACTDACPVEKYADRGNICLHCDLVKCKKCATAPTYCSECHTGTDVIYKGDCITSCPAATVEVNGECLDCVGCTDCTGSPTNCPNSNSCPSGQVSYNRVCQNAPCPASTYQDGTICKDCSGGCLACNSETDCTECKATFVLHNKACSDKCPANFFDNGSKVCEACGTGCKTCTSKTDCSECISAMEVSYKGNCTTGCPPATVLINNTTCQDCVGCAEC
jgi:hypothetical protein